MFRILIISVVFAGATFGDHLENSSNVLVITNATIIDGTGATPRPRMSIIIDDRRITTIESSETADIPKHAQSIDATGKYVIPGLWDMHIHLFATGECALPALAANGVTGVRDMGGLLRDIDEWRIQIDAGVIVGPRIIRSGPMLNGRQFGIHQIAVVNEPEARGAVRALHKAGVDFIKVHRAITREAYFGAVNESRKLGIPLVGHIPNTVTPHEASDAGQVCVEHVGTLFDGTFSAEHQAEPLRGRP